MHAQPTPQIELQNVSHSIHLPSHLSPSLSLSADQEQGDLAVASIAWSNDSPHLIWASCSRFACLIDLRNPSECVQTITSSDDIGTLALNDKDKHLALGDDSGNVSVVDLAKPDRPIKAMRPSHSSIVSRVAFRRYKPWDLVSTSLDHTVVRWDFSRGKCLREWKLGMQDQEEVGPSSSSPRILNPPMVHCISLADRLSEGKGPFSGLAAAAVGDGSIAIFDLDAEEKAAGPKTSKSKPKRSAVSKESEPDLPKLAAGLRVDLDLFIGGHSSPASSITFLPSGFIASHDTFGLPSSADLPLIASGGEDRRILIWSLSRSLLYSWSKSQVDVPDDLTKFHPLVDIKHKRKINCLHHGGGTGILFVADTGKIITGFKSEDPGDPEILKSEDLGAESK